MGSPFGLLAAGAFFVATGVGAIVVEHRWPGGVLSLLLAATFLGLGIWMLVVRSRSDDESRDPSEPV
jgi:tellurite resistance protein TehA-like permease